MSSDKYRSTCREESATFHRFSSNYRSACFIRLYAKEANDFIAIKIAKCAILYFPTVERSLNIVGL